MFILHAPSYHACQMSSTTPSFKFMRHLIMLVEFRQQSSCLNIMRHLIMLLNCQHPMTSSASAAGFGMENAQQTEPLHNLAVNSLSDFMRHRVMPVLSSTGLDECVWISVVAALGSLTLPECVSRSSFQQQLSHETIRCAAKSLKRVSRLCWT